MVCHIRAAWTRGVLIGDNVARRTRLRKHCGTKAERDTRQGLLKQAS